jgi:YidC/Oxa1 family membrane protein insertase
MLGKEKPSPERMRFVQDSIRAARKQAEQEKLLTEIQKEKEKVSGRIIEADTGKAAAADTSAAAVDAAEYGTVTIIGEVFTGEISRKGAVLSAWRIPAYKDKDSAAINLIPEKSGGMLNLTLGDRLLDSEQFSCDRGDTVVLRAEDTLVFRTGSPESAWVEKRFVFRRDAYDFVLQIRFGNMAADAYTLGWKSGIRETEANISSRYADKAVNIFYGGEVDDPVGGKDTLKEIEGFTKWASLRSKYFSGTLVPEEPIDLKMRFRKLKQGESSNNAQNYSIEIIGRPKDRGIKYRVILCPNQYSILKSYGIVLEKILFKGYGWFFRADVWFPPLCGLVLYLLNMFYAWIPNYGAAILLLTLLSKIVTLPLTLKSSRSMARMKLLQPKMQAIREKYKSDPANMNKAVMNMYREEGVNPIGAGGCLPMILQMPIFIALFVTLRKSIELRGAPFMLWIDDLSGPEALFMLPGKFLFYGPNVSLLTIIMAVTMYFQSKQTMTDPKQKSMVILMPVIMLFMLNSMPSGLMLYWAFSNVLGIIQNKFIKSDKLPPPKPKKKKKRFKPLSYSEMLKKMRG